MDILIFEVLGTWNPHPVERKPPRLLSFKLSTRGLLGQNNSFVIAGIIYLKWLACVHRVLVIIYVINNVIGSW